MLQQYLHSHSYEKRLLEALHGAIELRLIVLTRWGAKNEKLREVSFVSGRVIGSDEFERSCAWYAGLLF